MPRKINAARTQSIDAKNIYNMPASSIATTSSAQPSFRLFDCRLTAGLHDERMPRMRCPCEARPRDTTLAAWRSARVRRAASSWAAMVRAAQTAAWLPALDALGRAPLLRLHLGTATCLAVEERSARRRRRCASAESKRAARPTLWLRAHRVGRSDRRQAPSSRVATWRCASRSAATAARSRASARRVRRRRRRAVGASVVLSGARGWRHAHVGCAHRRMPPLHPGRWRRPASDAAHLVARGNETKRARRRGRHESSTRSAAACGAPTPSARSASCGAAPRAPAQQRQKREAASAPLTVTLNADVSDLAVSTDGTLVCAVAGRDGVLILDGNARLRSRLNAERGRPRTRSPPCTSSAAAASCGRPPARAASRCGSATAVSGCRGSAGATTARAASAGAAAARAAAPSAGSQVWGACADGTLYVWLAEAAVAEAVRCSRSVPSSARCTAAAPTRRASTAVHGAVAVPLLKLMRVALDELRRAATTTRSCSARSMRRGRKSRPIGSFGQKQDKLAVALNVETIARIDAEERRAALVKEVDALQYDSHLGQSRDQALALKAAREC